ncbi:hypothetical protein FB645_000697 [Coemansia sp. IMI 203386]|nr:hypothetical protein FB645_000697 [Coemansia sp. IMI 203386]
MFDVNSSTPKCPPPAAVASSSKTTLKPTINSPSFQSHPQQQQHRSSPLSSGLPAQDQAQKKKSQVLASSCNAVSGIRGIPLKNNPAIRAMGKQGALPAHGRNGHHLPAGLASPTDKLMSPATRGVNKIRHKKIELPKPRVLGALFESMKSEK